VNDRSVPSKDVAADPANPAPELKVVTVRHIQFHLSPIIVDEIERLRAEVLKLESHIVDVYNAQEAAQGETGCSTDAKRYQRLRVLGCAVGGTPQLDAGLVSRFTNLDAIVDEDIAAHPDRGEAKGSAPVHIGMDLGSPDGDSTVYKCEHGISNAPCVICFALKAPAVSETAEEARLHNIIGHASALLATAHYAEALDVLRLAVKTGSALTITKEPQ